jgi:hypothetical protein
MSITGIIGVKVLYLNKCFIKKLPLIIKWKFFYFYSRNFNFGIE